MKDIKKIRRSNKDFFKENNEYSHLIYESDEIKYRLASGTVGIQHATNQVIEEVELPMMIAVYIVIIILVFATYLDYGQRFVVLCR